MHHPWPTHSSISSKTKLNAFAPNFYHLILLIHLFFHLPHLPSCSILSQPLSLKFTNSFLLPKINNVHSIPSQLSFWNFASMNLVQSSQTLSISLFLKEFFHRHSDWFTCSFHSICPIITWQKGFLCHRSTTLEFTPSWYSKLVFSANIPFQAQNTPLQNCFPSLGSLLLLLLFFSMN